MSKRKPVQSTILYSLMQAAGILGIHRNTLSKWIDQGCPIVTRGDRSTGAEWEISIPDVIQWQVDRAVADAVARYEGDGARITKDEADRRRAVAQAISAEVDADLAVRNVVSVADVADAVATEYAAVRTQLQGVGSKVAGRAVSLTSAPAIQNLIDDAIFQTLEGLTYDQRPAS